MQIPLEVVLPFLPEMQETKIRHIEESFINNFNELNEQPLPLTGLLDKLQSDFKAVTDLFKQASKIDPPAGKAAGQRSTLRRKPKA